jgi:glutamate/tyrosine decarboxylase-like PLP-dependent enzyme
MHTDAAYGGACALTSKYKSLLNHIEFSDSITFDAHKWLSVPMGAGIYLTRHQKVLQSAFQMTAQYMPKEAEGMDIIDPYNHSLQWSRRFIGLKLYFALLMIGWEGYKNSIEEDFRIGNLLKKKLERDGWKIYNDSPLPILCFNRPDKVDDLDWTRNLVNQLVESRKIWLSTYPIEGKLCIRICITNYLTREREVDRIVNLLNEYQKKIV